MINQYKAHAGKICDNLIKYALDSSNLSGQSPYVTAELSILKNRKTKGAKAALLTGLVIGALIERGFPDLAEKVLVEIDKLIDINKIN